METNIDFVAIAGIIGAVLPLVISALKQQTWATQIKKYLATGLAFVAAIVYTGASEGWAVDSFSDFWSYFFTSFTVIFALAQTTYKGFWQDTAPEVRLAKLGDRTT